MRIIIRKYEAGRKYYLTDRYNETEVRNEFLDPLFHLLGWDITNAAARPTHEREVLVEEPLKAGTGEHTKKPDYTFRLYAERKFFLEAKKPHIDRSFLSCYVSSVVNRFILVSSMKYGAQ